VIITLDTPAIRHISGTFAAAGTVGSVLPNTSLPNSLTWPVLSSHSLAMPKCITVLAPDEVWDGPTDYAAGSLVGDEWQYTRPKRSMTAEEIAVSLAERKTVIKARVSERFRRVIAAGKVVSGKTIDITAEGFTRLEQAKAVVPVSAVTSRGDAIDLPDTDTVDAILVAGRAQYKLAVERERALYDAIDDAADHAALDLINAETGAIDDVGGWPTP